MNRLLPDPLYKGDNSSMGRGNAYRLPGLLVVVVGCYQGVGSDSPADGGTEPGGSGTDSSGTPVDDTGSTGGAEDMPVDPGPSDLRRLTNIEYRNALAMLTGAQLDELGVVLPPDTRIDGFSNRAATQSIAFAQVDAYRRVAEAAVALALQDPVAFAGCDVEGTNCLESFVRGFGRRAFRRPLRDDEVETLLESASSHADPLDPWSPVAIAAQAMLQSPKFLFRVEVGEPDPLDSERSKLTGYEVASRLSFLLWAAPPDDELLDAAGAGELNDAGGVEARAMDMLDDPRTPTAFEEFGRQWFRIDSLEALQLDDQLFPHFDDGLRAGMVGEMELLLADAMWGDSPFVELYSARYGWANHELAELYGVLGPADSEFERIDWTSQDDRGGLLASAGALAMTSLPTKTAPVGRGLYVREVALCTHLPAPPDGVEDPQPQPGDSPVDTQERHTSDPNCAQCHLLIDPIGWGLDRYGPDGALRETNEVGEPVRLEGELVGFDPPDFAGGMELGEKIAASTEASHCAVNQVIEWSFGRALEMSADGGARRSRLESQFEDAEHSFRGLLLALVASDAFRYRRAEDGV